MALVSSVTTAVSFPLGATRSTIWSSRGTHASTETGKEEARLLAVPYPALLAATFAVGLIGALDPAAQGDKREKEDLLSEVHGAGDSRLQLLVGRRPAAEPGSPTR